MKLVVWAMGLAVVWCLKACYSNAGADDLSWILTPTCRLAGWLADIPFEWEARTGWISHSHRMIVGPACAGVNFLIIAFATYYFTLADRFARPAARILWLPASLAIAVAVTVPANALRIVVAAHLHGQDRHGGILTPERVHRGAGVVIFCAALIVSYIVLRQVLRHRSGPRTVLAPIACYLLIALGVPLVNGAWWRDPVLFFEHAAVVAAACAAACGAWMAWKAACGRARECE
ncbi:MAG: exosortase K [Candidatus Polarisedimenticolia bacterium]